MYEAEVPLRVQIASHFSSTSWIPVAMLPLTVSMLNALPSCRHASHCPMPGHSG